MAAKLTAENALTSLQGNAALRERVGVILDAYANGRLHNHSVGLSDLYDPTFSSEGTESARLTYESIAAVEIVVGIIQEKLGPHRAHADGIRQCIRRAGFSYDPLTVSRGQAITAVLRSLVDASTATRLYTAPNQLIGIPDEIHQLTIGPVSIYRRSLIRDWQGLGRTWDRDTMHGLPHREGWRANVELCWMTSIDGMDENVPEEARWRVEVAASLLIASLPLFLTQDSHPPPFGHLPDVNLFQGCLLYPVPLSMDHVRAIESANFQEMCTQIFDGESGTVGERLHQGLGWLARSRQARDTSEKFLFAFTAIEAVLSPLGDRGPVVQTIARNIAVMQFEHPLERIRQTERVVELYNVRSRLVHNGVRAICSGDQTEVTNIATYILSAILTGVPMAMSHKSFCVALADASFGLTLHQAVVNRLPAPPPPPAPPSTSPPLPMPQ